MNISTRQMKAFLCLARLQSFTRAAEQLHITQAGLSAMMRDLETQFDCRLFDRTTRAVSLTPAGLQLVPRVERMLAEFGDACLALGKISAHAKRVLTVAVAPVVASSLFAEVCEHFGRKEPEVTVRLRDVNKERILAMVESGEVDVGFCAQPNPAAATERLPLFKCHLLCIAKPGVLKLAPSRDGGLPTVTWAQLPALPILASADPSQGLIDAYLDRIGRAHEERPAYESMPTIIAMAASGFGIGFVPSFALPTCLRLGVEVARLQRPSVAVDFYRITKKGREVPRLVDPFVASLVEVAHQVGVAR
ncbi:LysR family transcriptional regulator [Pigmentiphaga humi]|nr:LysR family transcriptional regulator [Pigmentiphaga humi]